jgi:hypothetical protein
MDEISLGSYEDAPRSLRDLMRKYSNTPQQGTDVLGLLKRVYGEGASNLESVLRGSAAAIPGFAGDIGQGFDIRGLRSLPTTEQILSKIPRATRPTKEGAGFEEVGTYLPLPISPGTVKQGAQAVQRGIKAAAPYAARSAVNLVEKYGVAPTMSVVKPKGGNWLAGHIEYATEPLKRMNNPVISGDIINEAAGRDLFSEYVNVNARTPTMGLQEWTRKNHPEVYAQIQAPEERAANRWIDTKLSNYIRNEMGTPEDPVRALAERGILHVDPQQLNYRLSEYGKHRQAGQEFLAESEAAKLWEGVTDNAIGVGDAGTQAEFGRSIEKNPWLTKVPPETKVYGTIEGENLSRDLGFDHLIDELKFAMHPNSGLPNNLRVDPSKIDKLTVPEAVKKVSQINEWRAKEAARAEKEGMMANLQAQPRLADENLQLSFVEKPGGTWVDIPETIDEKGMKLCSSIGRAGGWCTQHDWAAKDYGSGVNRLTALVDAEGRPHAQAKITQIGGTDDAMEDVDGLMQVLTAAERKKFNNFLGSDEFYGEFEEAVDWLRENMPKAYAKVIESRKSTPPDITELKPPGNAFNSERSKEYIKRDPEYKQKVTNSVLNFLNSGDWGNVKDLHHYDIVDMKSSSSVMDALQSLYGDESGRNVLKTYAPALNAAMDATPDAPRFMTLPQLRQFIGDVEPTQGFAAGGLVAYDPDEISRIAEEAVQGFAPHGIRHSGEGLKGKGYFGKLPNKAGGHSTEISTEDESGEYPLIVPTLTAQELDALLANEEPTEEVYSKARSWADTRRQRGQSPFAAPTELRMPRPGYAGGGLVKMLSKYLGKETAKEVVKEAPKEQKMLMGVYRGYAGERGAPEEVFATPQRSIADYYAQRRAAELGAEPHAEMLLVDPFAGQQYGLSIPLDKYNREYNFTRARKLKPEDVKDRTPLYAAGGLVNYDPNEIDTIVSQLKEEFHG